MSDVMSIGWVSSFASTSLNLENNIGTVVIDVLMIESDIVNSTLVHVLFIITQSVNIDDIDTRFVDFNKLYHILWNSS